MTKKSITILGSTGSIGTSTVKVISEHPELYDVQVLTAYNNVELLIEQAKQLQPELVVIGNEEKYARLKEALPDIETATGLFAITEAAKVDTDFTMLAIVGIAGLKPALAAVRRGKTVALANKECLVTAGDLFMQEVARHGTTLLPVDSEHNAVFQAIPHSTLPLEGGGLGGGVEKIILTASGGPFRTATMQQMREAIPQEVVAHPNWNMGAKISVDSATMMNKGLEIIEAHHLFNLPSEKIEVVVHPESIIHGMAAYKDGSVLSQMSNPDMMTPIAHTLAYPNRISAPIKPLNFSQSLTFYPPDEEKFPALKLAREALKAGGNIPIIMNGANEVAVDAFLSRKIGFLDIVDTVQKCMDKILPTKIRTIEDVLETDAIARKKVAEILN